VYIHVIDIASSGTEKFTKVLSGHRNTAEKWDFRRTTQ